MQPALGQSPVVFLHVLQVADVQMQELATHLFFFLRKTCLASANDSFAAFFQIPGAMPNAVHFFQFNADGTES